MANYRWRDSPDVVARLVNADKIQTFRTQEVLLKPNEACAFIVDGKIGDILTETKISSLAGGFSRWVGDQMGMTANDRRLLFAMTGPMDYWVPFEGSLTNGEMAKGYANLRMKLNTDDVPKLLNWFANNSPILTRDGVISIIKDELHGRVITPSLASCTSSADLRGADFLERFEMTAEMEMRNLLSNLGFTLLKSFPITNPTDMELVERHRSKIEAQMEGNAINLEAQKAEFANKEALTLQRIEMETNVARAHARGQVTVKLEHELKALRAQEATWAAELERDRGKVALAQDDRKHASDVRIDEADAKSARAMDMFKQVQDRKAERISTKQEFQNQRMDNQNDVQVKMMEMAKDAGALTPEVMSEFLRQQTQQKVVDSDSPAPAPQGNNCNCGTALQPGWKACPNCGSAIG
jgi:hypothetical protein